MIYSRSIATGLLFSIAFTASRARAGEFEGNLTCLAAVQSLSGEDGAYDSKKKLAVVTAVRYNERGFYVFTGGTAKFFKIRSQPATDATSGFNGNGFNEDDEFYFKDENGKEVKYRAVIGGRQSPAGDGSVRYDSFAISDIGSLKADKNRPQLFSLPRPMEIPDDLARKALDESLISKLTNLSLTLDATSGAVTELRHINTLLGSSEHMGLISQSNGPQTLPRLPGPADVERMSKSELLALKAVDEKKVRSAGERALASQLKERSKAVHNALDICTKNGTAKVQKAANILLKEAASEAAIQPAAPSSGSH